MSRVVNSTFLKQLQTRSHVLRSFQFTAGKNVDSASTVVVVESPQKALKLQSYLGPAYNVIPSFGHICDLPKKQAVDPKADFSVTWELNERGAKQLDEIACALKSASKLILATDPDREGEAISWHIAERLKKFTNLTPIQIERITFNEISKSAILQAIDSPRQIDTNLVEAYLARRVIDYLLGFTLSPVLWRKLPGARSAGRVQSACLRLICERENEIVDFVPQEYWTINGEFCTSKNLTLNASLTCFGGKSISKSSFATEASAHEAVVQIQEAELIVKKLSTKGVSKKPLAPYRTSTLQQDAAQKLGWDAKRTMSIAQQLYDGRNNAPDASEGSGLITYMRTDGVNISKEGIEQIRDTIEKQYGSHFLPKTANVHSKKVLNAQEAHEAIRPLDVSLRPDQLPSGLQEDERKLYGLIWRRTMASQMTNAEYRRHSITLADSMESMELRASHTELLFDGYRVVYTTESSDEETQDLESKLDVFKKLKEGDKISRKEINKKQHFTKAPPRYNDASIVKTLEELGIGRPSTFAFITSVLVTRKYVAKFRKVFNPWPLGLVLTVYLKKYFQKFVDYDFTSEMEERLDEIAEGKAKWKSVTYDFWNKLTPLIKEAYEVQVRDIIDYINTSMLTMIFHPLMVDGSTLEEVRKCPACIDGTLLIKFSRNGPFIGCSNFEKTHCTFTASMNQLQNGLEMDGVVHDFGEDKSTGGHIYVKNYKGKSFVELITTDPKLKRVVPVPTYKYDVNSLTLEKAKRILKPLMDLGVHPKTGLPITIEKGRARSKYLKHGDTHIDLPKELENTWGAMDQKTALEIIEHKQTPSSSPPPPPPAAATEKQDVKRPRSAYIFFIKDHRKSVKEQNPTDSNAQIVSKLAALWRECPEEIKSKYQDRAAQDKLRYQEEIEAKW
eukprot:g6527.t1